MASQMKSVRGTNLPRKLDVFDEGIEAHLRHGALLNSVFLKMAEFFIEAKLGTEEEAYVCIMPAFKDKISGEMEGGYEETEIIAM